jgi:hypothetical protein
MQPHEKAPTRVVSLQGLVAGRSCTLGDLYLSRRPVGRRSRTNTIHLEAAFQNQKTLNCSGPGGAQAHRWTLGATFARLHRRLCGETPSGTTAPLCLQLRCQSGDGIKLWLGVTYRLRQHRAELVFRGRLRLNVRLWGCGHRVDVLSANLNLKAAGLPPSLNHEFAYAPLPCASGGVAYPR